MRSLSSRNIWGAFWGGGLGILACGLFSPWALPLGCLLGISLGFWYDQVWASLTRAFQRAQQVTHQPGYWSGIGRQLNPFSDLAEIPADFQRWYHGHRYRPVALATNLAVVTATLLLTGVMVMGVWLYSESTQTTQVLIGVAVGLSMVAILLTLIAMGPLTGRQKVRLLRGFQRDGFMRPFFDALLLTLHIWFSLLALGVFALVLYSLTLAIFAFMVLVPVTLFISSVRLARRLATTHAYYACFSATIVVTPLMAWFFRMSLNGVTLWLVALMSGCLAAAVAECVRRGLLAVTTKFVGRTLFANSLEDTGRSIAGTMFEWCNDLMRPAAIAIFPQRH